MATRSTFSNHVRENIQLRDQATRSRQIRDVGIKNSQDAIRAADNMRRRDYIYPPPPCNVGGRYNVISTGNALADWVFEVPNEYADAITIPCKFFGICMTAYTILFPTMFCVISGTTWSKMDKGPVWMLVRLTAFFWSVYGVTKGTQKIVQLFEKYQKQRSKEFTQ